MRNLKKILLASASAVVLFPAAAHAEGLSANVGFVSDYVFRGVSQSDESFALQGGFDYEDPSGLHAGVWGSNIDFNNVNDGNLEVDISEALPTGTNKIGSVGLVANTVQDGTGTEKNLVCDTNGKLLVSIPDEDYQQYPAIVTTVPSTDIITSVPVVNIPRYFTYSTLFSAITESHSQSYDDNTQGFTNTIVTTGFTKISVVGKITNTFPDELSNVLRVELWPVFSSSPSEDHADNMIGPVASGLFIKDYLYFDTVELLYPYVKLRVVNEGISDAVLNLRVYMRK